MESTRSKQPRIACAMADDYPWDVIRERQLPGVEFEVWHDCLEWGEAALLERLRGVTAIVTGRKSPCMPDALIEDRGQLRAVFHCHGGVRQLVTEDHLRAGLVITNWGKNAGGGVAMGALVLLFNCLYQVRSLHEYAMSDKTVDGRIPQNYPCTLFGAKIGLYGFGPIGSKMEEYLRPFSPDMAIYDPYAKDVPDGITICDTLEQLFDHSDIVSIHCGLNDHTRNSVTGDLLDRLPQGGILVNTARGHVVDEDALAKRVHAGRLLAGLDVCCVEPNWSQSPLVGTANATFTAHRISSPKGGETKFQGPKLLPSHVVNNIHALLGSASFENVIDPDEYALKT